ncbi:MAG TPA: HAMP domain-containing sensor histidine kinase [Gemmatimonadales bacterium]|nr:HAMP domain-containing sensor histidine kinase [Gemmatimonadales bacterium]
MTGFDRRREVLRQASVALEGRIVTMWRVSERAEVAPEVTSVAEPPHHATNLDLDRTLRRWGVPIIEGSRWVGCRLNGGGAWCVAPVRAEPAAPPPDGVERRSRERITLELTGLGLGALLRASGEPAAGPLRPSAPGLEELAREPGVIAHEVGNPLAAAAVTLELSLDTLRAAAGLEPGVRAQLLADLAAVEEALDRATAFLRAVQDRARGALARHERFDAVRVVRSCVRLETPLLRRKGVGLELVSTVDEIYLHGDPNGLFQVLTNLIRNAGDASAGRAAPIRVELEQHRGTLRLRVRDEGIGIPAEYLTRVFEPGFTTKGFGSGAGMGLTVVRDVTQQMFGGHVRIESVVGAGTTVTVTLPIPPQRSGEGLPATREARPPV